MSGAKHHERACFQCFNPRGFGFLGEGPILCARIEDDALGRPTARLDLASPEAIANHDLIKEWDGKEIDKIVSEGDGGPESALLINQAHIKMYDKQKSLDAIAKTYEKLPPEPPEEPASFTINGDVVVSKDVAIAFLCEALGIGPEQIPVTTIDGDYVDVSDN